MSNKLHPLDGALKRIERAEKHLQEVVTEIESYRRDNYDRMFIEFDKATDNITVGVTGPPLIPMCISLAISDCVHNFRSALDYVVYELARYDSGGKIQSGTQFPIENTRSEFIGQRKRRLKGLSNSHVDAIEAYQPYKGVKWTKTLQTISNPDKHRHLIELGGSFEHDMILTGGAPGSFAGLPGKSGTGFSQKAGC